MTKKTQIRIKKEIVNNYFKNDRSKVRLLFSMVWAKIHLWFICPFCKHDKRMIRDVFDEGECYWYNNWKKKNYDIPLWMGFEEWKRIKNEQRKK